MSDIIDVGLKHHSVNGFAVVSFNITQNGSTVVGALDAVKLKDLNAIGTVAEDKNSSTVSFKGLPFELLNYQQPNALDLSLPYNTAGSTLDFTVFTEVKNGMVSGMIADIPVHGDGLITVEGLGVGYSINISSSEAEREQA